MNKQYEFHEKNLDRVNYWLQFAEAKNAAIIAFVVAMLAVVYSSDLIKNKIIEIVVSVFYLISLIVAMVSFCPKTSKRESPLGEMCVESKKNFLFWGDLANFSPKEYVKYACEVIPCDVQSDEKISDFELMYAEEIVVNAKIAESKYCKFKIALIFSIISTILMLISLFL